MSAPDLRRAAAKWAPPIVLLLLLAGVAVRFRHALVAWFTVASEEARAFDSSTGAGDVAYYTCPMHPSVHEKHPGPCPICGMTLVPVTNAEQASGEVRVDAARRKLAGVRTAPATRGPMKLAIRATGKVTYDESKLADVTLRVKGWITHLYVAETGQHVKKGQTLFTVYSPDLYSAEQDYLLAMHGQLAGQPSGQATSNDLARAARERLKLLGVPSSVIAKLDHAKEPFEALPFPSPASGYVIEKNVVEGAALDPGQRLFRIAELDRVWIDADVYEADLPHVAVGTAAKVTLPYLPGREYDAKTSYVYPYLDHETRAGRVRLELANKGIELKPDMYADVRFDVDLGERLQIPASAVVYTGPRRVVFVDLGDGRLAPREVQLGARAGDAWEVVSGLSEGDVVVTSGNFLVAAESRIRSATRLWDDADADAGGTAAPPPPDSAPPAAPAPAPVDSTVPAPSPPHPHSGGAAPEHDVHEKTTLPASVPPSASDTKPAASQGPAEVVYTCPMHPEVHEHAPGSCPKCGMKLVPAGGSH